MRGKNFNVLGILFLFGIILLSTSFVSAEVTNFTILNPVANANVTGTFTVIANATNITGIINVSVRWWNGTLGNWAILCANVSVATNGNATCAFSTSALNANVSSSIFNITAVETGGVAANSTNMTGIVIDNTAPTIISIGYVNGTLKIPNTNLTINISISDINITGGTVCIVNVNGTNQTLSVTPIGTSTSTIGTCNTTTLSLKGIAENNQTINIYAGRNSTFWNANLTGVNNSQAVFIDGTGPQVDLSLASSTKESLTLNIGLTDTYTATSSCTVDRSGATVSGTTSVSESGLTCATAYTYVVTCTDVAGNTGSASKTVSTNACGGGAAGGGGTAPKPAVNTFTQITPGAASITKYADPALGIKQIEITVNNEAQNVKVSVTKYDSKPAEVSVSKSGKVYQYLQISEQNLGTKLDKAKVQFKVEKSWASSNSLDKDKISVYKFDNAAGKWNELKTTFSSEDSQYYYYDAELSSFSYFVISEKSLAAGEGTDATGETPTAEGRSWTWLWILIAVVIIAAVWLMMRKKEQ
ncbi:MAG: PGF-pre-PGF domain-containing protein [Nanoarchaeota archaeon]